MCHLRHRHYFALVILLAQFFIFGNCNEKYSGIYAKFPTFQPLPLKLDEAVSGGYTLDKECESSTDQYGAVYSKPGTKYLPGLIYNTHGQLSGMVIGLNRSELMNPDEVFAPFSHGDVRGTAYWFRHPSSVCDPQSAKTDTVAHGIWVKLQDGSIFQMPEKAQFPNMGYKTSSHWTEHLCLIGMGKHVQYGECQSQYQFTAFYDAKDELVGVINAVNLKAARTEVPELMETLTVQDLMGLVFNESRIDSCFNLDQPRFFIHTYLKRPELEYQSCVSPPELTPANNPVKRCALCHNVLKSLSGADGACAVNSPSGECCCEMSRLFNQTGSCGDLESCVLTSGCENHDLSGCTAAGGAPPVSTVVAVVHVLCLVAMAAVLMWE